MQDSSNIFGFTESLEQQLVMFMKYTKCKIPEDAVIIDEKKLNINELEVEIGALLASSKLVESIEETDSFGLLIDLKHFCHQDEDSCMSKSQRLSTYLKKLKNQCSIILALDFRTCEQLDELLKEIFLNEPFTNYLVKVSVSVNSSFFSLVYIQKFNVKLQVVCETFKIHLAEFNFSNQAIIKISDLLLTQFRDATQYIYSIKQMQQICKQVVTF